VVAKSKPNNGDNLQNLRRKTSETFRKKEGGYLKDKVNELETNNKAKLLKTSREAQMNLGKVTNIKLIISRIRNPQSVLNRRKHFFNHVLNMHVFYDVRQMAIHTIQPLLPEPSLVEVEVDI
jgi:hypothetical protein